MEDNRESFSYTYSAQQREEVRRIRQKYLPPQADKLEQLRELDRRALRPGRALALTVGVAGSLVLGVGMCCTTVWTAYFVPGVLIGLVGLAGMGAALPVYAAVNKRQRKKLAPRILELARELMGDE